MFFKTVQIGVYTIIPVLGLLFFNWDWRQIVILYWFENISLGIVALINLLRSPFNISSLASSPQQQQLLKSLPVSSSLAKLGTALFFSLHYGGFTLVHGIFVFALTSGEFSDISSSQSNGEAINLATLVLFWLLGTAVQIVMSLTKPAAPMALNSRFNFPYGRIVSLHLSIIFGAFLITLLGLPSAAALLLVVIHGISDFLAIRKQNKLATTTTSPAQ